MAELFYQRDVYGKTLVELGGKNPDIVVLDADLSSSTRTGLFAKAFPERFFNMGVAEQNLMGVAAGLAVSGKTVFASTFAIFATGRAWDQVRNGICYNHLNVKIVATHAGLTVGPDGASHQALEDLALVRVIPGINVVVPCDGPQTKAAVLAAAETPGPFYIRLGRAKVPTIEGTEDFRLGKAQVLREGGDVAIIACGMMVGNALKAAEKLAGKGVRARVINMHTLRPFDADAVKEAAGTVRGIVVCEEHSIVGGLCSAVAETLQEEGYCGRVAAVAIKERFGQSGDPDELIKSYKLTAEDVERAALESIRG
ncbi:MAG: transketolase family protein [Elusimicrobia bacterium]|nr:transketolase family protein [Elusimicrobiota bacterium]